jgi:hypothetical protein
MYRKNLDAAFLAAVTAPSAANPITTAAEVTTAKADVAALQPMEEVAGVVQVKSGFGANGMKVGTDSSTISGTVTANGLDSYTKLLLHGDGSDDGTTFTDSAAVPSSMSIAGTTVTKTGIKKFGTASILGTTSSSCLYTTGDGNFALTAAGSDFALDAWVYFVSSGSAVILSNGGGGSSFDDSSGMNYYIQITNTGFGLVFHKNGSTNGAIGGSGLSLSNGTWYHAAIVKTGTTVRLFVDGVLFSSGDCTGWTNTSGGTRRACVGGIWQSSAFGDGSNNIAYLDEVRLSVGTDRGWSGGFTVPALAYSDDVISSDLCTPTGTYSFAPASLGFSVGGVAKQAPADLTAMDAACTIDYSFDAAGGGGTGYTGAPIKPSEFCDLAASTFANKTHLFLKFTPIGGAVITAPKLTTASTATLLAKSAGITLSVNSISVIDLQADGDGVFTADISADDIVATGGLTVAGTSTVAGRKLQKTGTVQSTDANPKVILSIPVGTTTRQSMHAVVSAKNNADGTITADFDILQLTARAAGDASLTGNLVSLNTVRSDPTMSTFVAYFSANTSTVDLIGTTALASTFNWSGIVDYSEVSL